MKKLAFFMMFMLLGNCASRSMGGMVKGEASYDKFASKNDYRGALPAEKRALILNAEITIETKNPEALTEKIAALCKKHNGYVVSSGSDSIIIRIEAEKFKDSMDELAALGDIVRKRVYTEDVTEQFRDAQIRLDNKLKARERYLELLKKAENVEATLKVEKELERLNEEIDSLKGKLARLSHLTQFSTITIYLSKKITPGPLGYVFWGLYKAVKLLFIWD